jgi:hypothetical protein
VAVLGALAAFKLLPGRGAPEVEVAFEAPAASTRSAAAAASAVGSDPDRYPEYVPYVSA